MNLLRKIEPLNWLLILFPVALVLEWTHAPPVAVFAASAVAIIPLAGLMGRSTEKLADRLGEGLGGLLNATFGNAAELIIALFALRKGMVDVVKASITGSILGNVLLVLGASFLAGGLKFSKQSFNRTAAGISSTLLLLAALGLLIPAVFHFHVNLHHDPSIEETVSLEIAVVLFAAYLLMLLFSLRTHRHLYAGHPKPDAATGLPMHDARSVEPHGPMWGSFAVLTVATGLVAWMSELLVGSVDAAREQLGLTPIFIGVIVIAIVGNAAEHSTAVLVALKNRIDLSYHIAVGSALQIALFVAPVLVFASYLPGLHRLDLVFSLLEVVSVIVSVIVIGMVAHDGNSNWLEGVLLLAVYVILAIAFFNVPEGPLRNAGPG